MIILGVYSVADRKLAKEFAERAYRNSGMHASQKARKGFYGYIVIKNTSGTWEKHVRVYWRRYDYPTDFLAKFKINNNGELTEV